MKVKKAVVVLQFLKVSDISNCYFHKLLAAALLFLRRLLHILEEGSYLRLYIIDAFSIYMIPPRLARWYIASVIRRSMEMNTISVPRHLNQLRRSVDMTSIVG